MATLVADEERKRTALLALERDARVTMGPRAGDRLALVIEAATLGESRDLAESLAAIDGVALIEVVSVDFSDLDDGPDRLVQLRREGAHESA